MLRVNLVALVAASAALAACSFFTKFEIEEVTSGGGGAGGSTSTMPTTTTMSTTSDGGGGAGIGGEGGMPPCEICRNCYPSIEACPALAMDPGFRIDGVADTTPDSATRTVWVTDAVDVGGPFLLLGNFGSAIEAPISLSGAPNLQSGFLMRGDDPNFTTGFGACNDNDTPSFEEVFMMSMARLPNSLVVLGGGYEGSNLVQFDDALDCMTDTVVVDGPPVDHLTPFLMWFNPTSRTSPQSLKPEIQGVGAIANGYISDVAALTGASNADRVVAIGIADGDPFDDVLGNGGDIGFYVVSAVDDMTHTFLPLNDVNCQDIQSDELWGLRSSIAVDPAGDVWAVGASCPEGDGQSFLTRIDTTPEGVFSTLETAVWGDSSNPMVITEIAISDSRVVIAGQYSGTPVPAWTDVPGFETGDQGDAFVMAFPLFDGKFPWNNTTLPLWFRRIRSDGTSNVDATVDALIVGDGAVWVSGIVAAVGGIGNAVGCYETDPLDAGRAYLAELDEVSGTAHFVRIDGFDTTGNAGAYTFARGTALVHPPNQLVSAVSSMGNLKLECNGGTPNLDNVPMAQVRVYAF